MQQHGQMGIYNQGAKWGSKDGNYQEKASIVRGDSCQTNITVFLLKADQGNQTPPRA